MAVRCRLCDGLRADISASPASILNDDLLSPNFRKSVCQWSSDRVATPARRKRHYQAHVSAWIGLRPRDPQQGRQSGSARGQMQELSSVWKLHGAELPSAFSRQDSTPQYEPAVRDFVVPYSRVVRPITGFESEREVAPFGLMSALASCGHKTPRFIAAVLQQYSIQKAPLDSPSAAAGTSRCYGRMLSISALSAASIVRYDASTAITRHPASAIQPVWLTRSISAHCSESSRAPKIELVPLIICAARRILGTSARAAASRSADRTDGV